MNFCIPKFAIDKFVESLPEDMSKIVDMTSAERRSWLEKTLGTEAAKEANALIESKIILKNQEQGLINAVKSIIGEKTTAPRDVIAKIQKLGNILTPSDTEAFLSDFVEKRLGVGVSIEEAGKLSDLSMRIEESKKPYQEAITKSIDEIKAQFGKDANEGTVGRELDSLASKKGSELNRLSLEYGTRLLEFKNYISALKNDARKLSFKDYLKNPTKIGGAILDLTKSAWSSLDNSFVGRQGLPLLLTGNFAEWARGFSTSLKSIFQQIKAPNESKNIFSNQEEVAANLVKAWAYSRPLALDGTFSKARLAIAIDAEEAFPSSALGKIPVAGRAFNASEAAYNTAAIRMRVEYANKLFRDAQEQGVNISDKKEAQDIGNIINAITGRGKVTLPESWAKGINSSFFSIRYAKAAWDILTAHSFGTGLETSFARKIAATNALKIYASLTSLFLLSRAIDPGSIDFKNHLGKIKIAGRWVNFAGGMSSMAQTAASMAVFLHDQTKSKNTPKYGSQTGLDIFNNFWEGKVSPIGSVARDYLEGKTFGGQKPTLKGEAENLATPLPAQTFESLMKDKNGGDVFLLQVLDSLGLSVGNAPKK